MSQLALAAEAAVSIRHLSFVETGRANPSRAMVLKLAEVLDVPLRERNTLLLRAGFPPSTRSLNWMPLPWPRCGEHWRRSSPSRSRSRHW
ncbi:helix-turn-helix domain-containing protein [Amycolatopsis sp. lyj-23]|uniref:helix-turn-helix domain-containing protein n=1 Tax=Amycolatopsis sp. lyj-23 TaxID=2789283 RepID=UPI00397ABC9E